jgi:hypothetical protein
MRRFFNHKATENHRFSAANPITPQSRQPSIIRPAAIVCFRILQAGRADPLRLLQVPATSIAQRVSIYTPGLPRATQQKALKQEKLPEPWAVPGD